MTKLPVLLIFLFSCASGQVYVTPDAVKRKEGLEAAVVSAHPLATNAGTLMFGYGGNAFDAAIATQLALAVVYPRAGNLGGGGFLVAHMKDDVSFTIDFRETAPAAADKEMYLDSITRMADTSLSLNGTLAAGVPGTIAGIMETYRYALLPFDSLIAPAIRLARRGFTITAREAEKLNANREYFLRNNKKPFPFIKNRLWMAGDTLIQTELSETLQRIAKEGYHDFYSGKTAELIRKEMLQGKGIITETDLAAYRVRLREPLRFQYKDFTFITMPLPSSGGMILHQVLSMLYILEQKFGPAQSPLQLYHRFIEAERRAFADRSQWPGDPDFVSTPLEELLSDKYLKSRIADFDPGKATAGSAVQPGRLESEETTHLSVVDKYGNAIAVTTTLNGNYGSKVWVQDAGFFLNNEMDDFSIQPGVANQFGAVGGTANEIVPGKRMLSSMTPSIILKKGMLYAVLGAPGGTTIPSSVLLTFLRMAELHETPESAVRTPRLHHQWWPDVVAMEEGFPEEWRQELRQMGYAVKIRSAFGSLELICREPDNSFAAFADPRGDDAADGMNRGKGLKEDK